MTEEAFDCTGLFDSHAHYFDTRFDAETEGADFILNSSVFGKGIEGVINVGTNLRTSGQCIEQAQCYEKMYAAVGIHPEDTVSADCLNNDIEALSMLASDSAVRRKNKAVAIGEIGLDYHFEGFDRELQKMYFEAQLELAEHLDLPVIIHDREAHGDCFEILIRHKHVRGVLHSFSGSAEMAQELVKRGWYISFSGVLTFKNARKTVEAAEAVPLDRILLETDCPYLAPHPLRGRINHSGLMYFTAQRLSEIKNEDYEKIAEATRNNVRCLFGV